MTLLHSANNRLVVTSTQVGSTARPICNQCSKCSLNVGVTLGMNGTYIATASPIFDGKCSAMLLCILEYV